jgi:hypothetical protein
MSSAQNTGLYVYLKHQAISNLKGFYGSVLHTGLLDFWTLIQYQFFITENSILKSHVSVSAEEAMRNLLNWIYLERGNPNLIQRDMFEYSSVRQQTAEPLLTYGCIIRYEYSDLTLIFHLSEFFTKLSNNWQVSGSWKKK